jgi:hypothetical protein
VSNDAEEQEAVESALLRRAEEAVEAAERTRTRSEVVVAISVSPRGTDMTARCAWCGRYRFDDEWGVLEQMRPTPELAGVTHGICEDCFADLRARGMSL